MAKYYYGMRLRPFAPFCQPRQGLVEAIPDTGNYGRKYHNILIYDRKLTDEEVYQYELDFLLETLD